MKTESQQTRQLMVALAAAMPGAVVFKHADRFTCAVPDISVNWGRTAWLEIKVAERGKVRWHKNWGVQLFTCRRLARTTGFCWFVVYSEVGIGVYAPSAVAEDCTLGTPLAFIADWDHARVATFVKEHLVGHHAE